MTRVTKPATRAVTTATTKKAASNVVLSDQEIAVNFGRSCHDGQPTMTVITMSELARRFSTPDATRGRLTLAEYLALDKTVRAQKM